MKDTNSYYGRVTRSFHWLMAILLIAQIGAAGAERLWGEENPISSLIGPWHIDIGVTMMGLIILRLLWAFSQHGHRPVQQGGLKHLATLGHVALYALMFLIPLLGILIMWGGGKGLAYFDMQLIAKGPEVAWAQSLGRALHKPLGWTLAILIVGHIGAALYHHFIQRDDVLRRMAGPRQQA